MKALGWLSTASKTRGKGRPRAHHCGTIVAATGCDGQAKEGSKGGSTQKMCLAVHRALQTENVPSFWVMKQQ